MKYVIIMMFVLTGCASERKAYKDGCSDVYIELLTNLDWKYSPTTLGDFCGMKADKYVLEKRVYKDMDSIR